MKYLGGPISEEEFWLRVKCYGQVKVEYTRKWLIEHGYNIPYKDVPIRVKVECDKFLDYIMGTQEAKDKIADIIKKEEAKGTSTELCQR